MKFHRWHASCRLVCYPSGFCAPTIVRMERSHGPPCGGKYRWFLSFGLVNNPYIIGLSQRNPLTLTSIGGTGVYGISRKKPGFVVRKCKQCLYQVTKNDQGRASRCPLHARCSLHATVLVVVLRRCRFPLVYGRNQVPGRI